MENAGRECAGLINSVPPSVLHAKGVTHCTAGVALAAVALLTLSLRSRRFGGVEVVFELLDAAFLLAVNSADCVEKVIDCCVFSYLFCGFRLSQ